MIWFGQQPDVRNNRITMMVAPPTTPMDRRSPVGGDLTTPVPANDAHCHAGGSRR
jgi:hypothetical protein